MPGFDGTGPLGQGAMTGGSRGNCAVQMREDDPLRFGRGFRGRGHGLGRGRGNCFRALRGPGQGAVSQLSELQAKYERLQADFEALKAKGQQA